jgi:DNA polymerase III alpha subunit (gram-positive type)
VPLKKTVDLLATRYRVLQQLPNADDVAWATRMLAYRLAVMVVDTTSINRDADIIRITVGDRKGSALFDRVIRPERQPGQANTNYTGIARELVLAAPSLAEVWNDLQAVLEGRYVLAYGFDFLQTRLNENAAHYGLQRLQLSGGECLMLRVKHYYNSDANPKLADICRRIGHEMPQPATTLDRLSAQLLLLRAMNEATMDVHHKAPKIVAVDAEFVPGEEDAPFDDEEYELP